MPNDNLDQIKLFVENLDRNVGEELNFFQTSTGILIGSFLLILFWISFSLIHRHGRRFGRLVIRPIKRPLLYGFGAALYIAWLLRLFEILAHDWLPDSTKNQVSRPNIIPEVNISIAIIEISICLAVLNLGRSLLLNSNRISRLIPGDDPKEKAMLASLLERLFTISVVVITLASLMVTFGVSTAAIGALLGGAGIGIGFGTQKISQNLLSGLMLFFNRPFSEGDWILMCNSEIEGTVEKIGWYHTRLRTFSRRPLYIPNSVFATNAIENPGRMYNRRIKASIGLRYEDISRINAITKEVRDLLLNHSDIDQKQIILVNFKEWDSSSINMMVYCFTKTTDWKQWLDVQQNVFLQIANIIKKAGGDFANPSITIYPTPKVNNQDLQINLFDTQEYMEG